MHETDPVDRAVEKIIQGVANHVDACIATRVAILKDELKRELAEHFDARHDDLSQRMAQVEDRVDAATASFDRWALLIRNDTGFTKALALRTFTDSFPQDPAPPEPSDPRPTEIDRAVAADPADGAQRVDLPEYGAVVYPRPGTDAEVAWTGASETIRAGRSGGEHRVSRRP